MNNERKLQQVHFQITRNCNLRCAFCGQWGKKGFFSDASGEEMTFDDWNRIISELKAYREETKISPKITVWGGEPLVSPCFDAILKNLKENCFETEIITNGVLIDRHKEVIEECVDTVYVSLDGTKEIHDVIRGKGVFDTVCKNIKSLNHDNIIVMSVITPQLMDNLNEFLKELDTLNIRALYLQDMIGLCAKEIEKYKEWLKKAFNQDAVYIDSWQNNSLYKIIEIKTDEHKFSIEHKTHTQDSFCKSPFYHAHITWNGEVTYCTDFYDFSAGNVKNNKLIEIFNNDKSLKFAEEIIKNNCPSCKHCSWRTAKF